MKDLRHFLSLMFFLLVPFTIMAQEDITDQYLQNADLSSFGEGWDYDFYTDWNTGADVPVVEFYHTWGANPGADIGYARDFHFTQTITLPAGDYRIAVSAFYREGNGNGTNTKAYIFAGDKQQYVYGLSAQEQADVSGRTGKYVGATDLLRAANAFSQGDFSNAFDFSLTTEQEITLGFRGYIDTYCSWCILGPVKLYKYSLENYLEDYRAKVAEANALTGKMGAAEAQALSDAIVPESSFNLSAEVTEAIATLTNAINDARKSIADYADLTAALENAATIRSNVEGQADANILATYDNAIADFLNAYNAGTVNDFAGAIAFVEEAVIPLVKSQKADNSDYTMAIINPHVNGSDGWTCDRPYGGNGPMLNNDKFEYWAGNAYSREDGSFDYYQIISGLPNGYYRVSASMYNSLNDEGGDYTEFAPTSGVYAASGANEVITLVEEDGTTLRSYTTDEILVTDGTIRIGVKNTVTPMAARWFVADDFHLTLVRYVGSETSTDIAIDATNFPDDNFRAWLLSQDYGQDGKLTPQEIEGITEIIVYSKDIADLTGIEQFTNLMGLNCTNNQLTSLDVSKNTALWYLDCRYNQLTSLDVSKNTALASLDCSNNQLTSLDVSKNVSLEDLNCTDNQLTSLDVSKNVALEGLNCTDNLLTSLDVSNNVALIWLYCDYNQLTSLDVSNNVTLNELVCYLNQLTSLDLTNNDELTSLYCYNNQIKDTAMEELISSLPTVDSGNLYAMYPPEWGEGNEITPAQVAAANAKGWKVFQIDAETREWVEMSGEVAPTGIAIDATNFPDENFRAWLLSQDYGQDALLTEEETAGITEIDVSEKSISDITGIELFTNLTYLNCSHNMLLALDVSKNVALQVLLCYSNYLTSLDVSKNVALVTLNCEYNQLTSLDVSKNVALATLNCDYNQLTSLDLTNNVALVNLNCSHNQIKETEMGDLISSLPSVDSGDLYVIQGSSEGNVITPALVDVANAKGWIVFQWETGKWTENEGEVPNTVTVDAAHFPDKKFRDYVQNLAPYGKLRLEEIAMITEINVSGRNIADLTGIEVFTNLVFLDCHDNQLTSLDVSKNTALQTLNCSDNQLTSLDVSNNVALTNLNCGYNQLTSLEVTNNVALVQLYCSRNQINESAMNDLISSLPSVYSGEWHVIEGSSEGNVITPAQVAAANAKGWKAFQYDYENWKWVEMSSEPTNTRVVLDENATVAPEAATGVDVLVKRTIKANDWSTIVLPFAMSEAQLKTAFGSDVELGDFTGYDVADDTDGNVLGITINFTTATAIEANHPYIIKVTKALTEFTVDDVDIQPEDEPTVATVARTSLAWSELIGTYVANTVVPSKTLFLSGNNFYYSTGATKMKAFRAYFDFFDVLTNASGSNGVKMFVDGTETKLDEITISESSNSKWFDLGGRKVNKPVHRGLYIVGGKKIFVK